MIGPIVLSTLFSSTNVNIFKSQGTALDKFAKKNVKVFRIDMFQRILTINIDMISVLSSVIQRIRIVIYWHVMRRLYHEKTSLV
jgi:hypothetical protein